ncbi:unnamed protein product, partial [Hapterophycus canaliculatus]
QTKRTCRWRANNDFYRASLGTDVYAASDSVPDKLTPSASQGSAQADRSQGIKGFRRATTASARIDGSRGDTHPRSGMFLPQAPYEAHGSNKFYTASSVCTLGRIFSDSNLVQPTWSKVATSPWGEAARVTGGYGERLLNG